MAQADDIKTKANNSERIPFKMHPRIFAALGADLVTNDSVAIVELVKNSYDAWATAVEVKFDENIEGAYLEVTDNGIGMSRNTISDVWCVVATPNKHLNQKSVKDGRVRRVSGEKGLGRLSVARLGQRMRMWTQQKNGPCYEVSVDWTSISDEEHIDGCSAEIRETINSPIKTPSGTIIKVEGLISEWEQDAYDDLADNLSRLISPFESHIDFTISLSRKVGNKLLSAPIEAPEFMFNPTYRLKGFFTSESQLHLDYQYNSIDGQKKRSDSENLDWYKIVQSAHARNPGRDMPHMKFKKANCGSFEFEIRAWDLDPEAMEQMDSRYEIGRSKIRHAIRSHKGVSIYRDNILVLPKTDKGRDWLGLDLRRVSKTGSRLSTSQIVGYVNITADGNPKIEDTSDRERLTSCSEVNQFTEILLTAIGVMENLRDQDKIKPEKETYSLADDITINDLEEQINTMIAEGATPEELAVIVREYARQKRIRQKDVERRWSYYRHLASVGTISHMLNHEILNSTGPIGYFSEKVEHEYKPLEKSVENARINASMSLDRLENFANKFSPLASRGFKRGKRNCKLSEEIKACVATFPLVSEIKRLKIGISYGEGLDVRVKIDPGELQIILYNLLTNSCYWMSGKEVTVRVINFKARKHSQNEIITLYIEDSGIGIKPEDTERVMLPGVTRKPNGLGMGLALSAMLATDNGGNLALDKGQGALGGATFKLELKEV